MPSKNRVLELHKTGTAPTDSAYAIYTFSDGSGATLTDSSGNGYNGTITSATWSTNTSAFSSGNSLTFDGNTDYVSLTDGMLTNQAAISLEFWFRITPGQETETRTLMFRTNGTVSDQIYIQASTNKLVADMGSLTSRPTVVTDYIFSPNIWYHVVVRWDSTDGTATERLRVYVNGARDTAVSSTGSGSTSNTGTWTNKLGYTTTAAWYGQICFTAFYTSALADATILSHFTNGIKKSGNYLLDNTWQLVEEISITSASQYQDFQYYLDGDNDGAYKIEAYIAGATSGLDSTFSLRINGLLATFDRSYIIQNGASSYTSSIQTSTNDSTLGLDTTTARQGKVEYVCYFPESGSDERYWTVKASHNAGGANRTEMCTNVIRMVSPTPSARIRALGIRSAQVGNINTGSKLRLYKLKFKYEQ